MADYASTGPKRPCFRGSDDYVFVRAAVMHVLSNPEPALAILCASLPLPFASRARLLPASRQLRSRTDGTANALDASRAALSVREIEVRALAADLAKRAHELASLKRDVESACLPRASPIAQPRWTHAL